MSSALWLTLAACGSLDSLFDLEEGLSAPVEDLYACEFTCLWLFYDSADSPCASWCETLEPCTLEQRPPDPRICTECYPMYQTAVDCELAEFYDVAEPPDVCEQWPDTPYDLLMVCLGVTSS